MEISIILKSEHLVHSCPIMNRDTKHYQQTNKMTEEFQRLQTECRDSQYKGNETT
jgi:hypothetical protein